MTCALYGSRRILAILPISPQNRRLNWGSGESRPTATSTVRSDFVAQELATRLFEVVGHPDSAWPCLIRFHDRLSRLLPSRSTCWPTIVHVGQ